MSKEIYISSTPHETRLAIVEHDELTEIYYERENEYTLAGSIYNGKVTRVLPGMQSSFVDVGLERDAFLYITDFMEEAGDSADFDTADRSRATPRRNDRGRDGQTADVSPASFPEASDRPNYETPRSANPTREPAIATPPESRSAERGERSDRNERGDRNDRGRRRGRGGNRDQQPREGRPIAETPAFVDAAPALEAPIQQPSPASGIDADLGEGAPGADGSRRWRGRRGRRRGRGGNREESSSDQIAAGTSALDASTLPPDPSSGYDLSPQNDNVDLEASATGAQRVEDRTYPVAASPFESSPRQEVQSSSTPPPSFEAREPRSAGSREGSDRGRRERGGRGRDRRDDRPRAPRGFAPSQAFYGVDDAADQHGAESAPVEPIILPGESLSKYRQGGEAAQSPSAAPAPAPAFTLPGAWDGGNVLPGETLRPRSPSASAGVEPRRDARQEGSRDSSRRDGRSTSQRDDRGRSPRSTDRPTDASLRVAPAVPLRNEPAPVEQDEDGPAIAPPTQAAVTLAEAAPAVVSRDPHPTPSAETSAVAPTPATVSAPEIVAVAPLAAEPASQDSASHQPSSQEYEPTEGSASYRVDPAPPREFRQPAPEAAPTLEQPTLAHTITPPPGTPLARLHSESDPEPHPAAIDQTSNPASAAPLAHDMTSISSEGEMVSQEPPPPPAQDIADPTSPLQHETAIRTAEAASAALQEPILPQPGEPGSPHPAAALPAAAPEVSHEADDLIVEELAHEADEEPEIEEEDFRTTTLHAASIEEMDYDDDEEETLEGAADLGTMLREMSIDEITQPSEPAHDEEDEDYAFEEEDSVEDTAFASSREPADPVDPMGFTEADFTGERSPRDRSDRDRSDLDSSSAALAADSNPLDDQRGDRRRGGRRDGRRGGRDRDRGSDRSTDRSRSTSPLASSASVGGERDRSSGSRPGSRDGRRDGHRSAQTTNLPAISDLLKPGQEVLVQIAKEPIAKKGARITSHIALPGRFLVFMPTVNHTGVSRKIESDGERRRLKEILLSEKGEASGGFIVRTAASGASEEELRSDLRFLLNLWADIKQRSEASKSPALIYHDLNLVERVLRDQVTDNFSAIWVDTETEYERVLRFLQRFQPSLIRRVKLYTKDTPLFEQFGITEEINKALRSKVWLKSGGSIVINQTEALVAIDINTGKYVGKTARLEDTIVKTNLDAIPEIVRQIRLRDLGGIIIIDFIDMDDRKNRHKVMAVLEEELKKDRAPSKVLQFNDFGLVAITRKRVKQSLERTLSTTCGVCAGTGMVKSAVTVCNDIYIEMRKMQKNLDRGDVMLRVNPEVVKQLKSPTAKWLQEMEEMVGKTILVKSDPTLHPEQFDIH